MKISILGTGYVGLITGLAFAHKGQSVICMDKDKRIIDLINKALPHFYEPGLKPLLKQAISNKSLRIGQVDKDQLQQTDVTIIAVGTPTKKKDIDLTYIKLASQELGESIKNKKKYHTVVVKSTVVPGVTRDVVGPIVSRFSGKKLGEFGLCMNPEFLREGEAIHDAFNPDRVVIGAFDTKSADACAKVYKDYSCPIVRTDLKTAEIIKYTSNTLLATLISFSNEIARICETMGNVDIEDVWRAIHLDHRLSPVLENKETGKKERISPGILSYLRSGCGYGGSCFPKDTVALSAFAKKIGIKSHIIDKVIHVNKTQPKRVILLLQKALGDLKNKKIAVLGLAFKPDTDDIRESPGITIASLLLKHNAKVTSHDPLVKQAGIKRFYPKLSISVSDDLQKVLKNVDAAIIATSWKDYKKLSPKFLKETMRRPVIIDGRRILSRKKMEDNKIQYQAIGYLN